MVSGNWGLGDVGVQDLCPFFWEGGLGGGGGGGGG